MDDSPAQGNSFHEESAPQPKSQDASIKTAMAAQAALENKKAMDEFKKRLKEKAEQENQNLWQHPFVDVFKHFKVLPGSDWKQNKRLGDVQEYFVSLFSHPQAKEIGRRAFSVEGSISANNYI